MKQALLLILIVLSIFCSVAVADSCETTSPGLPSSFVTGDIKVTTTSAYGCDRRFDLLYPYPQGWLEFPFQPSLSPLQGNQQGFVVPGMSVGAPYQYDEQSYFNLEFFVEPLPGKSIVSYQINYGDYSSSSQCGWEPCYPAPAQVVISLAPDGSGFLGSVSGSGEAACLGPCDWTESQMESSTVVFATSASTAEPSSLLLVLSGIMGTLGTFRRTSVWRRFVGSFKE